MSTKDDLTRKIIEISKKYSERIRELDKSDPDYSERLRHINMERAQEFNLFSKEYYEKHKKEMTKDAQMNKWREDEFDKTLWDRLNSEGRLRILYGSRCVLCPQTTEATIRGKKISTPKGVWIPFDYYHIPLEFADKPQSEIEDWKTLVREEAKATIHVKNKPFREKSRQDIHEKIMKFNEELKAKNMSDAEIKAIWMKIRRFDKKMA